MRHARYAIFQMAEVAVLRELIDQILRRIDGLAAATVCDAGLSAADAPSQREACVRMTRGLAEWLDRAGFLAADAAKVVENYGLLLPVDSKAFRMKGFWLFRRFICEISDELLPLVDSKATRMSKFWPSRNCIYP